MKQYTPIIIAHRGLTSGPDIEKENRIESIEIALEHGYMVECDIWYTEGFFWLGHDRPEETVPINFMLDNAASLFVHCKNYEAMVELIRMSWSSLSLPDFFWHEGDKYTITANRRIWAYPLEHLCQTDTVCVLPELHHDMMQYLREYKPMYVCTKYCDEIRKEFYGY